MLISAPRGTVNRETICGTPRAVTQRSVTGMVAAEDAEPQAVIQAGEFLSQYLVWVSVDVLLPLVGDTYSVRILPREGEEDQWDDDEEMNRHAADRTSDQNADIDSDVSNVQSHEVC